MMDTRDIDATEAQALAQLLEAGLLATRVLQERLLNAEDDASACKIVRTMNSASRSVRQVLLLRARLRRDAKTEARDDAKASREDDRRRSDRLKDQIRSHIARDLRGDRDDDDDQELEERLERLDVRLREDEAGLQAFLAIPLSDHLTRYRAILGVTQTATDSATPFLSHAVGEGNRPP